MSIYEAKGLDKETRIALGKANETITQSMEDKLGAYLEQDSVKEVIWNAYKNNPVYTIEEVFEFIHENGNYTEYEKSQNLIWGRNYTQSIIPRTVWYYENGDTLFVRKGKGWACFGGGLKESGII